MEIETKVKQNAKLEALRETYILSHAPQVLAALIVRRTVTDPAELARIATASVAYLYDHIKENGPIFELVRSTKIE